MLRRSHILTAVVVLVACAALVPSAYAVYGPATPAQSADQAVPPPSSIAESADQAYQDLRSPDARDAKTEPVTQVAQDLRSPDARDAARAAKVEVAQDLRSPDARDAGRTPVEVPTPVVEIREVPSSGFDWGDAGIGAAGILALLSIAGGLTLMSTSRRRRGGTEMPAH
jgi:hypothetical protein